MIALIITTIGGTILNSKLTMYWSHLVFSRLAANTLGLPLQLLYQ